MAVYTLTVGGVTRVARRGSIRLLRRVNVRPTLEVEVLSLNGSYLPAEGDPVALLEGGVTIYGGRVQHPTTRGVDEQPITAIATRIDCLDNQALADDLYLTTTFAGGTLKAFLQWVIAGYLGAKGTTLDPSQADGPAIPARGFTYRSNLRVSDGLTNACAVAVGWAWTISAANVLSAHAPNAVAAPFNVAPGDHHAIGDVSLEVTSEQYANRIIVLGNQSLILSYKDDLTAMTDGVRVTFPLTLTPAGPFAPLPNAGVVWTIADAGYAVAETFGDVSDVGSPTWQYDAATNTITDTGIYGGPGGSSVTTYRAFPLPTGRPLWIIYDGTPTAIGFAESVPDQAPPRGVVERVVSSDVQDTATLNTIAQAELIKALALPQTVTYETDTLGLAPGQVQTITVPQRSISGTFVIQQIETRDLVAMNADRTPRLRHTVTAVEYVAGATAYPGTVGDLFTAWSTDRGGAAGAAPAVTTSAAAVGPALPPRSIQFNDAGVFGGSAEALLDKNDSGERYGVDDATARVAVGLQAVTAAGATFTKLYLAFDQYPTYTPPTLKGDWDDVASMVTRRGVLAPVSTGSATLSSTYVIENGTTPVDLLNLRIVSDPLAAQTLSGTFDLMVLAATQPWPDMKACWHVHVYCTVGDSDAVRCTLLPDYRENNPSLTYPSPPASTDQWTSFPTGFVAGARLFTPVTLSSGSVLAGDRLVVELGAIARNTYGGFSPGIRMQYGEHVADADAAFEDTGGPAGAGGHNNGFFVFSSPIARLGSASTSNVQLAIFNRTAGLDQALTIQQTDAGATAVAAAGPIDLAAAAVTVNGAGIVTSLSGDVTATGPGTGVAAPATIANDAVTYAKLQNVSAASKLLGRGSASGAGDAEEITLGTGLTMTGTTLAASGGGGAGTSYDCPLSDGDLTAASLIFASGECVIVQVPV